MDNARAFARRRRRDWPVWEGAGVTEDAAALAEIIANERLRLQLLPEHTLHMHPAIDRATKFRVPCPHWTYGRLDDCVLLLSPQFPAGVLRLAQPVYRRIDCAASTNCFPRGANAISS